MRRHLATIAGGLALCVGLLTAVGPAAGDEGQRGRWSGRLQQKFNLTDDQMTVIRDVFKRHAEERRQLGQALRLAQTDLRQLALTGGAHDAVRAKAAEVQQLLGQGIELRVKVLQEIAPSLTQEQREKMAQVGFSGGPRRPHHKRRAPAGTGT
jgi:Spy/CpxP family protein refolding chaperone